MTTIQSISSKAGRAANNPLSDAADLPHAYVQNGDLYIMTGGRFRKADGWDAIFSLLALEGSPFPESQERARQIRAALKETMQ